MTPGRFSAEWVQIWRVGWGFGMYLHACDRAGAENLHHSEVHNVAMSGHTADTHNGRGARRGTLRTNGDLCVEEEVSTPYHRTDRVALSQTATIEITICAALKSRSAPSPRCVPVLASRRPGATSHF
jgi:hypothetical protein